MRSYIAIVAFLAVCTASSAQPLIAPRGIVNGASFMAPGLPAGSIAQGSLFTIFGIRLGPTSSPGLSFPLSTTLGGVSVKITQGATTVEAIPVFVGPGQINAIMPSDAPLGKVSIRVTGTFAGTVIPGPPSPANIVTTSVGIFGVNSAGTGQGVMQQFVSAKQMPYNAPALTAKPGQVIILYATGLGPIQGADNEAPPSGNLSAPVEVFVGGVSATVQYHGRSSCCAGLDQINFQVPANAPTGCWVPIQVRTNSTVVSNTLTMAISSNGGGACSDPLNALSQPFLAGKKIGAIALLHADVTEDVGLPTPGSVITDSAMLTFQQEQATPVAPFHPIFSLPPAGTCTAYAAAGDLFDGDNFPGPLTTGKFLDAGATFALIAPNAQRNMGRPANNERNFQPLGYTYTGYANSLIPSSLVLVPGNYTLTGPGGADVGAINAKFNVPTNYALTWTNRATTEIITRSQGFTINWTGAPAGEPVIIYGGGVDAPHNATALFVCVASPGASSFTVPPQVLANIQGTRRNLLRSKGVVYVGALPTSSPINFTASGLDVGVILPGAFFGKTVIFQ